MRQPSFAYIFGVVLFVVPAAAGASAAVPNKPAAPSEGRAHDRLNQWLRLRERREARQSRVATKLGSSVGSLVDGYGGALASISTAAEAWGALQTTLATFADVIAHANNEEPINGTADQGLVAADTPAIALDDVCAEAQAAAGLEAAAQHALQVLIQR